MEIQISINTTAVILTSLNDNFMRYAQMITVDEKDTGSIVYLKRLMYGMKSCRDVADRIVDELEAHTGDSFYYFRTSPDVMRQVEELIHNKEKDNA